MVRDYSSRSEPLSAWLREVASTSREAAVPELLVGDHLCGGRYEVEKEVGRGGMGIVYAAWDNERRERVALKTLTRRSPSSIYRIKQEFRGLGHVVHPHLVRLHELFEDHGRWCFTLELVPGDTLLRALRGAAAEAIRPALLQLADGINALHAAGKLHRDLKPSNVMLTPSQRVVILDFGLAEDIAAGTGAGSMASGLSGTPDYMAPELKAGGGASEASDWYSFGVIVWELLTGHLPLESERRPELAGPPRAAAPASERIPADLAELCRALLSPQPLSRPLALEVTRRLGGPPPIGDVRTPLGSPAQAHGFLGRARELDWMRQAYAASCQGNLPVVLLLSGESGIGKTTLVQSFVSELGQAWALVGRCYEREFVPFKAFDGAIDGLCRHLAQVSASELSDVLPAHFADLCRLFPVLGRVQEPTAHPTTDSEDDHELRRRGFEALGVLLERLRARRPVVLWIDDLQWTDADSTHLLLHLLRQATAPQILLIASHRSDPEAKHPYLQPMYEALATDVRLDVRRLELGPLSHDDATALLASVSPGAPRALVERAQGHPFLLEELSRYAARQAPGAVAWPSLEEAIGARIEALGKDERRTLEVLALATRPLPEQLARTASGPRWHASLQALCSSRLARRDSVGGHLSCYHDAIREAVLSAVSARRARQCHRALALAMLRGSDLQPEHLALHLTGAGHPARAAEQTVIAAQRAAASLAFERAAQLYLSALELGSFAPSDARPLQMARAHALSAAGRGKEAADLYLALLDESDETETLELRTRAAEQYLLSGRIEQGLELLRSALRSLGLHLPTTALGAITSFVYHRARLGLRGYHFDPQRVPTRAARRLLLLQRASVALMRLDPLRAGELASRGLLLALETGSAAGISTALVADFIVGTLSRASDAELARRQQRAEQACARFGGPQEQAFYHSALATAARLQAQPDLPAALAHLERFFQIHREHVLPRASYERPWEQWAQAVVRCLQGDLARVAREVPARLDEGWARGDHCIVPLWAGGDALLARLAVGDVAAAERDLARALRVWSSRSFTIQDLMLAMGAFQLERYRGNARAAWLIAENALTRLETSPLRRMPNAVDTVLALRGHAALELAARTGSARERRELLQLARDISRDPPRHRNLAAVFRCQLLAAAWRYQQGDREGCALALQRAEPHLEPIPLYAHAVRYRRGMLRGDPEGADWAAAARQRLAAGGAVEPERLLNLLLPGYTQAPALPSTRCSPEALAAGELLRN